MLGSGPVLATDACVIPRWICVAASLLSACTEPANAQLAELLDLGIALHVITGDEADRVDDDRAPVHIRASTGFEEAAFVRAHGGACAVLGAVAASFNGAPLEVDPGGADGEGGCDAPVFEGRLEIGIDEPAVFELADDSAQIRVTFASGEVSPRIASLTSPAEWSFTAGQDVTMTWSHPEDAANSFKVWFVEDGQIQLPSHYAYAENVLTTNEQDGVSFRVPDAFVGIGAVVVSVATATEPDRAMAETCIGAARCSAVVFRSYKHAVTLLP